MNIATSTATSLPAPAALDAAQDTQRAASCDDGDDATPDTQVDGSPGFGHLLSQSMTRDDVAPARARGKGDTTTAAPATAGSASAPADPATAAGAPQDSRGDTSAADPTVGDDLAAQLALVSQWAALAAQGRAGAAGGQAVAASGVDVRGKLDTVRGAASAQRAAGTGTVALAAIADAADAARNLPTGPADPMATAKATMVEQFFATVVATRSSTGGTATGADPAAALDAVASGAQVSGATPPAATAPATAAAAEVTLHEAVGTPAWSHEVGQAALRMAANDLQSVSLRLNPEHLGPVDVQMRVADGLAHLQFVAAAADTRAALEGSKTTLDQLFAAQGIKLGDWSVGQQSSNAMLARDGGRHGSSQDDDDSDATSIVATVTARAPRAFGLVDTFA